MSNTQNLNTRARNAAVTPEDIKITHIKKQNYRHFVNIVEVNSDGTFKFVDFYFSDETMYFYCIIPKSMFNAGVRLPQEGSIIELVNPSEVVMNGIDKATRNRVYVNKIVAINKNFKTAKMLMVNV